MPPLFEYLIKEPPGPSRLLERKGTGVLSVGERGGLEWCTIAAKAATAAPPYAAAVAALAAGEQTSFLSSANDSVMPTEGRVSGLPVTFVGTLGRSLSREDWARCPGVPVPPKAYLRGGVRASVSGP